MTRHRTTFEDPQYFSKCPKDYHARLRNPLCMKVDAPHIIHSRTFVHKPVVVHTPVLYSDRRPVEYGIDDPDRRPTIKPTDDPDRRPTIKPTDDPDREVEEELDDTTKGILGAIGGAALAGAGAGIREVSKDLAIRAAGYALASTDEFLNVGTEYARGYSAVPTGAAAEAAESGAARAGTSAATRLGTSAATRAGGYSLLEGVETVAARAAPTVASRVSQGLLTAGLTTVETAPVPQAKLAGLGLMAAAGAVMLYESIFG